MHINDCHIFMNLICYLWTCICSRILYNLQHGFRKARSCESQLIDFIQELNSRNNQNIQTDLIIMDFAKAVDKVPHKRLLYKLQYYGIKLNKHSQMDTSISLRPHSNSSTQRHIIYISTSHLRTAPGHCPGAHTLHSLHK